MPDNHEDRNLVAHTELVDIRTVRIDAGIADELPETLNEPAQVDISLKLASEDFKASKGNLRVRTVAEVSYSTVSEENSNGVEFGAIKVVFELNFDLNEEIDPETITSEDIQAFDQDNLIFMVFPYVRSALQSLAAELRLPPTVLPFLRR